MCASLFKFKLCKSCKERIEIQDFRISNKKTGARRGECYFCELADRKAYRKKNSKKIKLYKDSRKKEISEYNRKYYLKRKKNESR